MVFNINQYTPVSVSTLVAGMKIDYEIFYQKQGGHQLLCKDVVLTPELILKFNKFTAPTYNIFVPNERLEVFIESGNALRNAHQGGEQNAPKPAAKPMPRPAREPLPKSETDYTGYVELKTETADLLDQILDDETVPIEVTEAIVQTVNTQIETVEISTIIQSINSVRDIDAYLYTHCSNVALLNGIMGKWLKVDAIELQTLIKIGLLHDIGKLKIPPEILNKPGKLTKEEFDTIKMHPLFSCNMLIQSGVSDNEILLGVLQHHEKVNGQGYPGGLSMDSITKFAKITSISDVYDAMVAARVYKGAHSPFQILAWFAEGCYSDLDITFVNVFLDCMTEEFRGKNVLLSDESVGTVVYVDSKNFEYPIVQVGEKIINTSPELRCVSLIGDY